MPNKSTIHPPVLTAAELTSDDGAGLLRQLDAQILDCTGGLCLSTRQQTALTTWARERLLSTYVASQSDAPLLRGQATLDRLACPGCGGALETIRHMLEGELPLEAEDLTFRCPPLGKPSVEALHARIVAWVHHRTTLAAQRTRWHTAGELASLRAAVETQLIVGALAWFNLLDLPDGLPSPKALRETTQVCLAALREGHGLAWTPAEPCAGKPFNQPAQVEADLQVAEQFGRAVAGADFKSAYALLTNQARRKQSPASMQQAATNMLTYAQDEPITQVKVLSELTATAWPSKRDADLAWVHVALEGACLQQLISLVLVATPEEARIREVTWGMFC